MDNGVRVMVPPFISVGEKIVVDTAEIAYVKRTD
jgi:elongation factor P